MTIERYKLGATPTAEQVKRERERAGLTQTAAAEVVYATLRSWQYWEAGTVPMNPAVFELFRLKTRKAA